MAKVKVTYTATFVQTIDWPDDELEDFNYNNLECNLDYMDSSATGELSIYEIKLNGKEHYF